MPHVLGLRCIRCAKEHSFEGPGAPAYVCPSCQGNLEVVYDFGALRREVSRASLAADADRSVWRYRAFFPVRGEYRERLGIGGTPLLPAPALGRQLGLSRVFLKDDTRNPSASFKDRAGVMALAMAIERGEKVVAGASTGNAASSLACLAARTGTRTVIFVPQTAPQAKVAQILLFGATVIAVRGTYDQAFDLCVDACRELGWYNRNTGYNPFTREGKKTCSFEIVEQLDWRVPDFVFVGVGDGNILSGLGKGFAELRDAGLVDAVPKLVAVQAGQSDAVLRAFEGDGVIRPVSGETIADSISVGLPRDGDAAVRALKASNGFAVKVTDDELLDAMRLCARSEGVFAEPAAAASVAGLRKAVQAGRVPSTATTVAVITGSGLKDVASAMKASGAPNLIDPALGPLRELLNKTEIGT